MFGVRSDGYKPGQCTTTIVRSAGGRAPAPRPAQPTPQPTPPPGAPAQPPPPAPPAAQGGGDVQLDCPLQALPRVGNLVGHVKDLESGASIASAAVKVLDAQKKELTGTTDPDGKFRFEQLPPGDAEVTVDAPGYLAFVEKIDIKARQDNPAELALKKKPKDSLVQVTKEEIVIKQQIQFAVDSAVILPESTGLLTEIADVFIKNPRVRKVEVQGHTDNTGTPDHNMKLSDDRASSVVSWLTSHGVGADRLVAKGYGQSKPIAPNVTAATRAKNRRVQFIILDQDEAPKPGAPAKNPF
jgi:outer membrane protein OmpA-like peptidoglycan-associated protein